MGGNTNDVIMKFVKEELDRDIWEKDLDRTYCVGNPKVCREGKSRPIIFKFGRYDVRTVVCKNNKNLKGKSFLITKILTAKRVPLLKEVQGKYEVRNVWTTDSRILYKENNRIFLYKNKVIKWHWNIVVKNWVKIDNIFCFFMIIFGVSGYIFKKFCISMGIALFIGNVPLRFYLRQLFISLHVFSYSSCKSIYLGFFSSFLNFLDIKPIFIFNGF